MDLFQSSIIEIFIAILASVISFIGIRIKYLYEEKINTEIKKKIVFDTVKYVEQISKNISISNENKKKKAKGKVIEWLNEKDIQISNTELDILIESAVNELRM